mgnify:CR=1 FL=1|jgi:hypothetical protein
MESTIGSEAVMFRAELLITKPRIVLMGRRLTCT